MATTDTISGVAQERRQSGVAEFARDENLNWLKTSIVRS